MLLYRSKIVKYNLRKVYKMNEVNVTKVIFIDFYHVKIVTYFYKKNYYNNKRYAI